jgi:hypothetical protein
MNRGQTGLLHALFLAFALAAPAVVSAADDVRESWDVVLIGKTRIGYFNTRLEPVKDRGRNLIRVRVDMTLSFKRGQDNVNIETTYGTIETPEGSVLRLDTRSLASRQEMRTHGDVIGGKMKLILENGGEKQEQTIDWGPDVRGPYGAELSLSREPMKPGETREVKIFIPDVNKICVAKLMARQMEPVSLGQTSRDLLRVDQVTYLDGEPMPGTDQTHWVDKDGQILRNHLDMLGTLGGMDTVRTTKEYATRANIGQKIDLNAASLVKVRQAISSPYSRRQITFDIVLQGDDPAKAFPADRRQSLTADGPAGRARLVVRTAGPTDGEPGPAEVDGKYLRANTLISTKDSRVIQLAEQATAGLSDPWEKASAIQHWVFQNVKKKNFETVFAPASEVARDKTGDCTEHSVLTAAMCRAVGIPSRVAIGLIYGEPQQGFGFHMWNEVYVNRRWVAIDASFDESQVDAVHLKLSETSLDGVSPLEAFQSVLRVLGKLKIEAVEVQ